jgi:hypothetical protein
VEEAGWRERTSSRGVSGLGENLGGQLLARTTPSFTPHVLRLPLPPP